MAVRRPFTVTPMRYMADVRHPVVQAFIQSGVLTKETTNLPTDLFVAVQSYATETSSLVETIDSNASTLADHLLGPDSIFTNRQKTTVEPIVRQFALIFALDAAQMSWQLRDALLALDDPYAPLLDIVRTRLVGSNGRLKDTEGQLAADLLTDLVATDLEAGASRAVPVAEEIHRLLGKVWTDQTDHPAVADLIFATAQMDKTIGDPAVRRTFWHNRDSHLGPILQFLTTAAPKQPAGTGLTPFSWSDISSRPADPSLAAGNADLAYWATRLVWGFSYSTEEYGSELQNEYQIVGLAARLLLHSSLEVVRPTLRLIVNLLTLGTESLVRTAVMIKMSSSIPSGTRLSSEKSTGVSSLDNEAHEDIKTIKGILDEYANTHSTIDKYASEIIQLELDWTPPHRDVSFWTENADNLFELHDGVLVDILGQLVLGKLPVVDLTTKKVVMDEFKGEASSKMRQIAVNDLTEILARVPAARTRLDRVGIHMKLFTILGSSTDDAEDSSLTEAERREQRDWKARYLNLLQQWYRK